MERDAPATVRSLVTERATRTPLRSAYVEGRVLTWSAIGAAVPGWDAVAGRVGAGTRIGLLSADPLHTVTAYLAALAAGVTIAPLDPGTTPEELRRQIERLGLRAAVTDAELAGVAASAGFDSVVDAGGAAPRLLTCSGRAQRGRTPDGGTAALLMASSGTTGEPKLIPLESGALLDTAASIAEAHGLHADDVGYSPLPLFHINGLVVGVLSTLVSGGTLVVDRRFSARRFWSVVDEQGATWLNLVPAIISVLSEQPAPAPELAARIAFARSASAPLPHAIRSRFEERTGVGVLETYGMTEAASQIAANPRLPTERRAGSVGRPVAVELRVTDRAGWRVPAGEVGEIAIRGSRIVSRYWRAGGRGGAPEERSAVDGAGWLATGDLGRVDADGFVYLVGRIDDVINRGGEKIFPREVEEVLLADPDVTAAAVIGRPQAVVGEEPVAYVLASEGAPDDPAALAARLAVRCEQALSRFKRPAEIVVTDALPAGPTGKIRYAELRSSVAAEPAAP
jgi:oxalate---CoA ligase